MEIIMKRRDFLQIVGSGWVCVPLMGMIGCEEKRFDRPKKRGRKVDTESSLDTSAECCQNINQRDTQGAEHSG